jgi:hypothetical protein
VTRAIDASHVHKLRAKLAANANPHALYPPLPGRKIEPGMAIELAMRLSRVQGPRAEENLFELIRDVETFITVALGEICELREAIQDAQLEAACWRAIVGPKAARAGRP